MTAAKVSHDNKLVAFICEQIPLQSQEVGLFISNIYLYNVATAETQKLTDVPWNYQTVNCEQNSDSANVYYFKPALEWNQDDAKLLYARGEINVCGNSDINISVGEITLTDKSTSIRYQSIISINEDLLDLNYSSNYQSAYLFIGTEGKIEVTKIPL